MSQDTDKNYSDEFFSQLYFFVGQESCVQENWEENQDGETEAELHDSYKNGIRHLQGDLLRKRMHSLFSESNGRTPQENESSEEEKEAALVEDSVEEEMENFRRPAQYECGKSFCIMFTK